MVSRYSVIQYVPDPITDERINIGVLAFDDDTTLVRFLSNWTRVSCFGKNSDTSLLKEFARRLRESAQSGLLLPSDKKDGVIKHERLLSIATSWLNTVQFTEPKGSLETVESLLDDVAQTFLKDVEPSIKPRDRQFAARFATSRVRNLLRKEFGIEGAKELLKTDYQLVGNYKPHRFDVTVANRKPFFAAHGLSFEVKTTEVVMDSIAWMIADVKRYSPTFPLAVVALPPKFTTSDHRRMKKLYEETSRTYKDLGAKVLEEEQVDSWVSQQLEAIEL